MGVSLCHLLVLLSLELSLAVAQLTPTKPNPGQAGMSVAVVMGRHGCFKIVYERNELVDLNESGSSRY